MCQQLHRRGDVGNFCEVLTDFGVLQDVVDILIGWHIDTTQSETLAPFLSGQKWTGSKLLVFLGSVFGLLLL